MSSGRSLASKHGNGTWVTSGRHGGACPVTDIDFLARRRHGIGASDIPALLGISPFRYATPMHVYMSKRGLLDERDDTPEQEAGRMLEPAIVRWFAVRHPDYTVTHNANSEIVSDPDEPWRRATPDGFVIADNGEEPLDAKLVGDYMAGSWGATNTESGVAFYVVPQVNWQAGVMGADYWHVAALIGGRELRTYRGAFDQELFDKSSEAARAMWDRVQAGDPPPADGSDSYFDYLRAEHPGTPATDRGGEAAIRAVGFDVDMMADTLLETTDELKELEREQKRLRQRLCEATGDHDGLQGHGWHSTWRANKRGTRVFRITREADDAE